MDGQPFCRLFTVSGTTYYCCWFMCVGADFFCFGVVVGELWQCCAVTVVMVFIKVQETFKFGMVQCRVECVMSDVCFDVVEFDGVLFIFRL